jgi:adenylate cyclase
MRLRIPKMISMKRAPIPLRPSHDKPVDQASWTGAGLYDPTAPDAAERLELLEYLASIGFTVEEMAANADALTRLASRRMLFGGEHRVTVARIAELSGCDEALVRRVRLAAGLADPGAEADCSPREAEVMAAFALGAAVLGEEVTLQFTRVIGSAAAGLAEAALATFAVNRSLPILEGGGTPAEVARAGAEATAALLGVPPVLDVLLRVHFDAASNDRFAFDDRVATITVAIGFVDLVGSTELTNTLSGADLAAALGDFERTASEALVEVGGRIVKRIGDAVMFVSSTATSAAAAALAIVAAVDAHPMLTTARAAVAYGDVLPRDGDYFGTAVNLAARAVAVAEPGMVVVTAAVRDALAAESRYVVPLGDHRLKGFDDPVALFTVEPEH